MKSHKQICAHNISKFNNFSLLPQSYMKKIIVTNVMSFQLFYDMDILEEKVLLDWGGKTSKKYVSKELSQEIHNKAEPFITWLREAEEEEESESEEEDDNDVEVILYL